jgi:hypothetical protein
VKLRRLFFWRKPPINDLGTLADFIDEDHAWTFLSTDRSQNVWFRNSLTKYFGFGALLSGGHFPDALHLSIFRCRNKHSLDAPFTRQLPNPTLERHIEQLPELALWLHF